MLLLTSILRLLLSLRYRITINGTELLTDKKARLVLPNHQAIVDPQILFSQIYRYTRIVPVVSAAYFNIPILKSIFKWIGAVPVNDLSAGSRDQEVLKSISGGVVDALKNKKTVLLYPAGQIAGQGFEKIFNKQSAWAITTELPQDTRIIGVRITGLWGSMWSRAWMGKTPSFIGTMLKAIFYILANGIFFLPRRNVSITLIDITDKVIAQANLGKSQFNNFLEDIYNQNGEERVMFLKHYVYSPDLKRTLPERIEGSLADQKRTMSVNEEEIPDDVLLKIRKIVLEEISPATPDIQFNSNLNLDLNIDSLGLVVIITAIEKEFKRAAEVEISSIKTIGDLCYVAMNRKLDDEELKTSLLHVSKNPLSVIRIPETGTIPSQFVKTFSINKNEPFAYDKMLGTTTRKDFLLKAMVVSRILNKEVEGKYVGIMLPALQSSTLLVAATYLCGKIPVMLNWTVGPKVMEHCIDNVQIKQVITAKVFYDKVQDLLPDSVKQKCLFFEQKVREVSFSTKLSGLLRYVIKYVPKVSPDDTAVILFTSGSESLPKAVPLTHKNILACLHGSFTTVTLNNDLIFLSFLPPFHSFGFSILTILPMVTANRVAYTPDPTDSREVLKILLHTKANMVLGTPTFLKMLLSVSSGNDLKHVKLAISGAESLHQSVIDAFAQKTFGGALLLEGYGITECSPVLTINPITKQKLKSVGLFIKGVEYLITNISTYEPLPQGKEGMIMVRGNNIFNGYSDKNIEQPFVNIQGLMYYKTGDLGYVDDEGYLFITGRLKRFIKIAGEMISLPAIENTLLEKYGKPDTLILAVEGNDQIEPPQLVLFSILPIDLSEANSYLKSSGFSSLVKLHKVINLEEIPILGTGKTDYKVLKSKIM